MPQSVLCLIPPDCLVELLVAATITLAVSAGAVFGLTTIMRADEEAEVETQRRMELSRALDFMAEEVKMAQAVAPDVNIDVHSTVASDFDSDCDDAGDGVDCALILQIPGVSQRVIYYVASPPNGSVWLGPRVIYRWGPEYNADGTYSNAGTPANWSARPLVDRIEGNLESPWHTSCQSGWSPNLPEDDRDSFYACVDPTGKVAEVFLLGALSDSSEHLEVKTKAFARSTP